MTYDETKNYCTIAPDQLFGISFKYECYLHDRQYRNEVTNRLTRKQADENLRDGIFRKFVKAGYEKLGFIVAECYYFGCRMLGWYTWKSS